MIGTRLAHYEILSAIGKGGMGEVWRARDTTLGREVAIKTLPEEFARDPDRLARFEREAKLLASLNHPHIGAIYGLEEHEGARFLVLELVEGETLAGRIGRGAIPVDDSLQLALQIARALEAAHEQGVIHRDLKPANIKVAPDGQVKVLDFGLAKAYAGPGPEASASQSPTLSMAATGQGIILGTAAYMSPEQARGQAVDKRTDIWAFGCVLYEMLTGRAAFPGNDVTDILAAVIRAEPEWTALPPALHPKVRELVERCLEKDPRLRWRDVGDVSVDLGRAMADPEGAGHRDVAASGPTWRRAALLAAGALALGVLIGTALETARAPATATPGGDTPAAVTAAAINLPPAAPLGTGTAAIGFDSPLVALSPDGTWLVYVGRDASGSRLYRRRLDSFVDPAPIPGTDGAIYAFFSPDGQSVGFLTNDRLMRTSLNGGDVRTIAATRTAVRAMWTEEDWIYIGENESLNLRRVRASSGEGAVEDVLIDTGFAFTDVLPNGRFALAYAQGQSISGDYGSIVSVDLDTMDVRDLGISGYDARWLPTGHLVFMRGGSAFAVGFDTERGVVEGEPAPLVRGVTTDSLFGHAQLAVSAGALAYVPGADSAIGRIVTVDRQGVEQPLAIPGERYGVLDLSANDRELAVHIADVRDYVWIYDLERQEGRKVAGTDGYGWPVWSRSGTILALSSGYLGGFVQETRILLQPVSGAAVRQVVHASQDASYWVTDWAPADERVAIARVSPFRMGFAPADGQEPIRWVDNVPGSQWGAVFSPDGQWVAYGSDETGRFEIWVRSYPDGNDARQLSANGGIEPLWCACGEVFFRRGNQFWSSAVRLEPELGWEPERLAFTVPDFLDTPGRSYDVSSDGQTLYAVRRAEPPVNDRIHVIGNWIEELRERVPAP